MSDPVITYTDAPDAYDGFGTHTLAIVGSVRSPMGSRPLRKVETPGEHARWQRYRYASGGYLYADCDALHLMGDMITWADGSDRPEPKEP